MFEKYDELITIIEEVKEIIDSPSTDISLSGCNTVKEIIKDSNSYIEQLKQKAVMSFLFMYDRNMY